MAPRRLGWSGVGAGVQVYQAWLLTAVAEGTHAVVANVVRGPAAKSLAALPPVWEQHLNTLWVAQLKRLCENAPDEGGG
ncbi:hypothetical protein [Streptomyces sp. NPDC002343]